MKTKSILLCFVLILICTSCDDSNVSGVSRTAEQNVKPIEFSSDLLKIEGNLEDFDVTWTSEELEKGLEVVNLQLRSPTASIPPRFSVKWSFPSIDIASFWNPNISVDKVSYYRNRVISRASSYAPVSAFLDANDRNRFTFACSDALNKVILRS
ncbi:MAG: hypothetical protein PVI66_17535, partial [Candidatus Aminicenantes bacterium]